MKCLLCYSKSEQCNYAIVSNGKYENKLDMPEDEWQNIYNLAKQIIVDNEIVEMQF